MAGEGEDFALMRGYESTLERQNSGARFIERNLREVFGTYAKVKQGRSHTVALAQLGD